LQSTHKSVKPCRTARWATSPGKALLPLLGLLLASCAVERYDPRPISGDSVARQLETNSLDAPGLRRFIQTHARNDTLPRWDLDALTLAAFYYNPDLKAARARLASAEAARITAGQRPNPSVQVPLERTLNPASGESPWTLGLALDIPIETAGKRGYRVSQADHRLTQARLQLAGAAWELRSALRAQALALWALTRKTELLRQQVELDQSLAAMLEQRLAQGYASTWELNQQRLAVIDSTHRLLAARAELGATHARLAALLGVPADSIAHATLDLSAFGQPVPEPPPQALRRKALLNRADVRAALAGYEASQAALQLEVAKQYPDLHLGPGYTFDQGARKLGFAFGAIELPVFQHNQGPIAQARAAREEAAAHVQQLEAKAFADTDSALAAYRGARANAAEAQSQLAIQKRQLSAAQRALTLGEDDRMSLILAQKAELAARLAAQDAALELQQAIGKLEDAIEQPLTTTMIPLPPNAPAP
jgi:outer membrane protein TolC